MALTVAADLLPSQIKQLHYVDLSDNERYDSHFEAVVVAITTDLAWVRQHTALSESAYEWRRRGNAPDLLLRGRPLADAELWISSHPPTSPSPTELQRFYIQEGRRAEQALDEAKRAQLQRTARLQRRIAYTLATIAVLVVVGITLGVRQSLDTQRRESRVFTSLAKTAASEGRFDRAIRYALAALPNNAPLFRPEWPDAADRQLAISIAQNRLRFILVGHQGPIVATLTSHDSRFLATGSWDGTARIWDATTGHVTKVLSKHKAGINDIALSADDRYLLSASTDRTAILWDVESGEPIWTLAGHKGPLWTAEFDPTGRLAITTSDDGTVKVWDTLERHLIATLDTGEKLHHAAISSDGHVVVTGALNGRVQGWNATTGAQIWDARPDGAPINSVVFGGNGGTVMTGSSNGRVRLWSPKTGQIEKTISAGDGLVQVLFTQDHDIVAIAHNNAALELLNLDTNERRELKGHGASVLRLVVQNRQLVSTSQDGTARVWDGRTGELSAALHGHEGPIRTASFSSDGSLLLTGSDDGTARLWAVHAGEIATLNGHTKAVWRASFSPDQKAVATASEDHTARLWSVTGTLLRTYPMDAEVSDARFVDAEHLVTSSWNGSVALWELATGRTIRSFRLPRRVRSVATCGGRFVATASGDGYTRLWNSQSGELLRVLEPPHSREAVRTVFDEDCSHLLTASWDRTATIYEIAERGPLEPHRNDRNGAIRLQGHSREVRSAEFDHTGTRIVTASYDRQLGIWDAISGSRLLTLGPAEAELSAATFSPDGSTIAAAAQDGSVEFWNSDTGESIWRFPAHSSGIWDVQFSPDGTKLLTASGDRTARIWDTSWITSQRGEALRERTCFQELWGVAQVFTAQERDDPIFRGVKESNPCSRMVGWRDRLSAGLHFILNRVRGTFARAHP